MGGIKISSSGNPSKRIGFSPALLLSEYFLIYFILFHYHFRRKSKRINAENCFVLLGTLGTFRTGEKFQLDKMPGSILNNS